MKRKSAALLVPILLCFSLMTFLASCSWDGDGPLEVMPNGESVEGQGYFLGARLDSGKTIHLKDDTLYVTLSQIWSFSNCSLTSIDMDYDVEDTTVVFSPKINIKASTEDCPSPMYRPDTTFKFVLDDIPQKVTEIVVVNDNQTLLSSILFRRGKFVRDTFSIFVDSSFDDMSALPLRTKGSPSILRVLDSITPQKFYWRTLRAKCTMRVDKCDSVVADTIYPTYWDINDTALVPVRYACASPDSVYCLNSKWEYDSTSLGKLKERLDTVWHSSLYYVEKIPSCARLSAFNYSGLNLGRTAIFGRELFVPDESERSCGPSTKKDWLVYNFSTNSVLLESEDETPIDSLYKIWKSATVAPDTLVVDTTESK